MRPFSFTKEITACRLCPRNCGAFRSEMTGNGVCGAGTLARVARCAPHYWEEPCISGTKGSGTVFFAGCSLHCVYCQNRAISRSVSPSLPAYDPEGLRALYFDLIAQGVHNINLVTPTHFAAVIAASLSEPLPVPVVWNSSGYEKAETLSLLEDRVQIYLADLKYGSADAASRYSEAPDYPETACRAIEEMLRQVGSCRMDENGILQSGVILRHLVLPGEMDNTFDVLDMIKERFAKRGVLVSLMAQYTPQPELEAYPSLTRRVSEEEYHRASEYMLTLGLFDGYTQEPDSAVSSYTPDFKV